MRLLPVLLLAALLAPAALAQTAAVPVQGAYEEVYVVTGRVVDAEGRPFAGGKLRIELDQKNIKAEPLVATANCKGDFITSFNLREPAATGNVRITAIARPGERNATEVVPLEPFWRRSDAVLKLDSVWGGTCTGSQDVWDVSVSLSARLLNRTDPFKIGEAEYQATPYRGWIRLRYEPVGGQEICPPQPNAPAGLCEQFYPDERGDVRYTFTLDEPFTPNGAIRMIFENGTSVELPVDAATRLAVGHLELTGRGAPEFRRESPAAAPALAALVVAALALASRSLLPRRRG